MADLRAKQHAFALLSVVYVHTRSVHVRARNWIAKRTREERKKREGKRKIYLPEFRRPLPIQRSRCRFRGMHFAFGIFRGIYPVVDKRFSSRMFDVCCFPAAGRCLFCLKYAIKSKEKSRNFETKFGRFIL